MINGNNHTVDAKSSSKIFTIKGSNITINDFKFLNVKETDAIFINGSKGITLNNCVFTNVWQTYYSYFHFVLSLLNLVFLLYTFKIIINVFRLFINI